MKMVWDCIDFGKWFCDCSELLRGYRNTTLGEPAQENRSEFNSIDTWFNVHDTVKPAHLTEQGI